MHIDYKESRDGKNSKNGKQEHKLFRNYEIFQGKIRLVEEGKAPIVMERDDAIDIAHSRGLDLVQIAYNKNDFPRAICKIIDYSKHVYEQKKREKMAKKQARANEVAVKEIDFSIRIDTGDMETKIRQIKKFLEDGDKVKIVVKLLRREMRVKDLAMSTMKEILAKLEGLAELDSTPSAAGNILSCVIRAKKQ